MRGKGVEGVKGVKSVKGVKGGKGGKVGRVGGYRVVGYGPSCSEALALAQRLVRLGASWGYVKRVWRGRGGNGCGEGGCAGREREEVGASG